MISRVLNKVFSSSREVEHDAGILSSPPPSLSMVKPLIAFVSSSDKTAFRSKCNSMFFN